MAEQALKWSFLNQETGQTVDGLDFTQAQFVTSMIDHRSRVAWLVWHDGLADWMNLEECDQLIGTLTRERALPPIPPNRPNAKNSTKKKTSQENEMDQLLTAVQHESKSERDDKRAHRRFHKNFTVEIMTRGGTIKMITENISHGGMMFQSALPEQLGRTFAATIIRHNQARLQVYCEQIRPPRGAPDQRCRRVRFAKVEDVEMLNAWLLDRGLE